MKTTEPPTTAGPSLSSTKAALSTKSGLLEGEDETNKPLVDMDLFHDEPADWPQAAKEANKSGSGRASLASEQIGPEKPNGPGLSLASGRFLSVAAELVGENSNGSREGRPVSSFVALAELNYRNRTTRLAHGHERALEPAEQLDRKWEGRQDDWTPAALVLDLDKVPESSRGSQTSEASSKMGETSSRPSSAQDILLLCKLLHKQLENGAKLLPNGSLILAPQTGPASSKGASNATRDSEPVDLATGSDRNQPQSAAGDKHSERGASGISTSTVPSGTTPNGRQSVHVDDPNELDQSFEQQLLQSTFNTLSAERRRQQLGANRTAGELEEERGQQAARRRPQLPMDESQVFEQQAIRFLIELFNLGATQSRSENLPGYTNNNNLRPESTNDTTLAPLDGQRQTLASGAKPKQGQPVEAIGAYPIGVKIWSKSSTRLASGGPARDKTPAGFRLNLVYWLFEMVGVGRDKNEPASSNAARKEQPQRVSGAPKYRLLQAKEAAELIDQLDYGQINKLLVEHAASLRPLVLVRPFQRARSSGESGAESETGPSENDDEQPSVIDDTLTGLAGSNGNNIGKQSSTTNAQAAPNAAKSDTSDSGKTKKNETEMVASSSALQLLVGRLTNASFGENFHLYFILFIVTIFVLVLCFSVPALCCKLFSSSSGAQSISRSPLTAVRKKQRRQSQTTTSKRRPTGARAASMGAHSLERSSSGMGPGSISGALAASGWTEGMATGGHVGGESTPDSTTGGQSKELGGTAIWRTLSNSTTTLVTDQSQKLLTDGRWTSSSGRAGGQQGAGLTESGEPQFAKAKSGLDAEAQHPADQKQHAFVQTDRRQVTKSVQTVENQIVYLHEEEEAQRRRRQQEVGEQNTSQMFVDYRDRLETRNSDTLTKSELVMLKEKLVPICGSKKADQKADYFAAANTPGLPLGQEGEPGRLVDAPTRHIDSSVESPPTNGKHQSSKLAPEGGLLSGPAARRAPSRRQVSGTLVEVVRDMPEETGGDQVCCSCCSNEKENSNSCGCRLDTSSMFSSSNFDHKLGGLLHTTDGQSTHPGPSGVSAPNNAQNNARPLDMQRRPKMSYLELPQRQQPQQQQQQQQQVPKVDSIGQQTMRPTDREPPSSSAAYLTSGAKYSPRLAARKVDNVGSYKRYDVI